MKFLYSETLEQTFKNVWDKIDPAYKKAFFLVLGINLLSFGFEATNLTLHHDDVSHIFIQTDILGHYLGRFGYGPLHLYTQNAYFMPFIQVLQGILFMTCYGLIISHYWGLSKTLDIVVVSTIISVFPYMAHVFQYNSFIVPSALAHLLVATAVISSTRATLLSILLGSALYVAAFSIYQSVVANAATIFTIWLLSCVLFENDKNVSLARKMGKAAISVVVSVVLGGLVYMSLVSAIDLKFDSYQQAGQAFTFKDDINLSYSIQEVVRGSRAFLFWPENYFPEYLKKIQLIFLFGAIIFCLWLPKNIYGKILATLILMSSLFAPRILQLIHPDGSFHSNALTAYAILIAGLVMIINRANYLVPRNLSTILAFFLIGGYIFQSNWISTVNYLNTTAHFSAMTQILTRLRSIPNGQWDGKTIAVFGNYDMNSSYPFKSGIGVATEFLAPSHMQSIASLMRDDITVKNIDSSTPKLLEHSKTLPVWPNPSSVSIFNGVGLVVLSKP